MKRRTALFLSVPALVVLAGCGGGTGGGGGPIVPESPAVRTAGEYTLSLQTGNDIAITLPGSTGAFSGSGTSSSGAVFTYSGTIDETGLVTLTLLTGGRTLTGQVTLPVAADAGISTNITLTDSSSGQLVIVPLRRTRAIPLANGPVNSLVAAFSLGATTRGVAVSPDGASVYTTAGGFFCVLSRSTGVTSRRTAFAPLADCLAVTADGTAVFAGGQTLSAVSAATGAATTIATTAATAWLTAPRTAGASVAYFGTADGKGWKVAGAGAPTALATLATGSDYLGASASADNHTLLVATGAAPSGLAPAAAAIDLATNTVATAPFQYAVVPAPLPSITAASPNGAVLYTVANYAPPRVLSVNVTTQANAPGASLGLATTRIADLAATPDGARLVAVASDAPRVYVLDTATMAVLRAIDVNVDGTGANTTPQVAISPDSARAYVSGQASVAVIRLK